LCFPLAHSSFDLAGLWEFLGKYAGTIGSPSKVIGHYLPLVKEAKVAAAAQDFSSNHSRLTSWISYDIARGIAGCDLEKVGTGKVPQGCNRRLVLFLELENQEASVHRQVASSCVPFRLHHRQRWGVELAAGK
jgi:hypothetical protein